MSVSLDELHQPPATCVAARARSDSWVRIMFATLADAGVKVVGTSGNGSNIPLSRRTLLPNTRLDGEAPVLVCTEALRALVNIISAMN